MYFQIGWFGYPGRTVVNKVHIVDEHDRPICKTTISQMAVFQFCAHTSSTGISMVECKRCKKLWGKMQKEEGKR